MRGRPIAVRREPLDQLALGLFRERVQGHLLAGATDGRIKIPGLLGFRRDPAQQLLQQPAVDTPVARSPSRRQSPSSRSPRQSAAASWSSPRDDQLPEGIEVDLHLGSRLDPHALAGGGHHIRGRGPSSRLRVARVVRRLARALSSSTSGQKPRQPGPWDEARGGWRASREGTVLYGSRSGPTDAHPPQP